ncbi:MAG: hypothetical protein CMJ62_21130 [Planctomycetaceae bacterium]|nr:hypothetical protein [Planctomycetaceae bacterium]
MAGFLMGAHMRFRKLTKWEQPENCQPLIFFAQILEELLFDYSLSTYKPSAMNTSLLCGEARETIIEIEKGVITKPNLDHILRELLENLSKDQVAKKLIDFDVATIKSILLDPKNPASSKKTTIELLCRQIDLRAYKKKNEELLINSICISACLKDIRELSRSYITTLLNIGYTSEHINSIASKFFYHDKNEIITGNEAITDFIDHFQEEPNEFLVIYRASKAFKTISNACSSFNVEISGDLSHLEYNLSNYKFPLRDDECFIITKNIKARDPNSAKARSDQKIETIATLFNLFHHKESPTFSHDCLIINQTKQLVHRSKKEINAMHKCIDLTAEKAAPKMNKLIAEFSLEKFSFQKFNRSAELHALALRTDSKENQMINLWIALESFVPAKDESLEISNIEHISKMVIPFINVYYFPKILSRLTSDLLNWNRRAFIAAVKGIEGIGLVEKTAKLLALPELEERRKALKSEFRQFYLLADRFSYLESVFSSTGNIKKALESHTIRIEWQIRRIYRARNLIVHSGKTPSYTSILIENTHEYLDCIFSLFIQLTTKPKKINDISQGFAYLGVFYNEIFKTISQNSRPFDEDLIKRIFQLNTFA